MRSFRYTLLLSAGLAMACQVRAADRDYTFDIPAQELSAALQKLAAQSGVQVFYAHDSVAGRNGHALKGTMTLGEALNKLLSGSGLSFAIAGDGSVSIKPPARDSTMLQPVNVVGKAEYDATDPFNPNYSLPNATTATKTDTAIMQTPMSVKVVPQQVLKDQQAVTMDQALRNVSGVVSGQGINREFFIRGFSTGNYYRDGYPFANNFNHTEDLANVDRVEVLKGPASILYGRAEPGGIINFVTKQPLDTPYYSLRQQVGSYDHYRTDIDATGPLTGNKDLAYRVNFAYQTNNDITEFAGGERIFAAPMLRWNISDKTVSTFKLEYSDIKANALNQLPLNTNRTRPYSLSRERNLSDPWSYMEDEYVMFSMNTEHRFNDDWSLRHRFNASFVEGTIRYARGRGAVAADGTVPRVYFFQNVDGGDYLNNFYNSLELTGKFATGMLKHTLLLGGDYLRSDSRSTMGFDFSTPNSSVNNPFHLSQAPAITDYETYHNSQPWFGLYGQDQIELPYKVHVLAGLRYDSADSSGDQQFSINDTKTIKPTVTDDRVSPRGGVLWQPIPELSLYGSYTENFGTSNGITADGTQLSPQTAQQWEIGTKTELWDGRFSGTLAYFDLTKQNLPMQVSQGYSRAVGEVESRGIELDVSGEILPGWKLMGAYAYMPFAKTLKDTEANGTIGKRLHNAPENSGSLWTTYEFQNSDLQGLKLGAGVQAVGRRYIGYTESAKASGYATLNLMASQMWKVSGTRLTAQLNADNLLDKAYFGGVYSYGTAVYGAPRTFMGSIKIEY